MVLRKFEPFVAVRRSKKISCNRRDFLHSRFPLRVPSFALASPLTIPNSLLAVPCTFNYRSEVQISFQFTQQQNKKIFISHSLLHLVHQKGNSKTSSSINQDFIFVTTHIISGHMNIYILQKMSIQIQFIPRTKKNLNP